ncbi:hypothetical protein L484_022401 [Morus notabilis]|uniref:Uncharacterized protein n=1 Tax=Morus notabilis TaxID=981085 RepID=W9QTC7_9ROSA|nr:hypothetical protein L484_022401 [Morus notabilis]
MPCLASSFLLKSDLGGFCSWNRWRLSRRWVCRGRGSELLSTNLGGAGVKRANNDVVGGAVTVCGQRTGACDRGGERRRRVVVMGGGFAKVVTGDG